MSKKNTRVRDAKTGRFVRDGKAKSHPAKTVRVTIKKGK